MLSDEVLSVVFDIGSLHVRAGFSGEDAPRYHSTSKVGEYLGQMQEEGAKRYSFGDEGLHKRRDNFEIRDSIHNGTLNAEPYIGLIEHCYHQLHVEPKEYSVLIANNMASKPEREKSSEIMFERIAVPNLFTIRNSVLSAFSAGRSTALVLDIGAYQTTAVAVHEGYSMVKTQCVNPIGGETISALYLKELQMMLKSNDIPVRYQIQTDGEGRKTINHYPDTSPSFHQFHLMEVIRDFKESTINVVDLQSQQPNYPTSYELPDGTKIDFPQKTVQDISESFFGNNAMVTSCFQGLNHYKGIHHMICDVLNSNVTDLKATLSSAILTTGGSSAISGLLPRLNNQLLTLAPPQCKVKLINYPSQQNRQHSVFIGGSIVASLSSFQSMWVTKQEYQEFGISILERKCPM